MVLKHTWLMLLLVITIGLAGCGGKGAQTATLFNDEIPPAQREDVRAAISRFLSSLKENNYRAFESSVSSLFMADMGGDAEGFFSQLQSLVGARTFAIKDEYGIRLGAETKQLTIEPKSDMTEAFIVHDLPAYGREMYAVFLVADDMARKQQPLLFLVLGRETGGFKVHLMFLGDYAVEGENFIALAGRAERLAGESGDGELIEAAIVGMAAVKLMRPAPFLQYPDEDQHVASIQNIVARANTVYTFPMEIVPDVDLFGFDVAFSDEDGITPIARYRTKTPLSQVAGVEAEARARITPALVTRFPVLSKRFRHILLRAYNEFPTEAGQTYPIHNTLVSTSP